MIEGREGFEALASILDVEGLDAIFLGPVDLAQSLGPGLQSEHAQVVGIVVLAVEAAARKKKAVAVFAPNATAALAGSWGDAGCCIGGHRGDGPSFAIVASGIDVVAI